METVTVNRDLGWLTAQHERMLGIVDGLSEEQMRTAVLPSGWTPVGMLVHVRGATRFWLVEIMLGDHPTEQFTDQALPGDSAHEPFRIPDQVPIAEVTAAAGLHPQLVSHRPGEVALARLLEVGRDLPAVAAVDDLQAGPAGPIEAELSLTRRLPDRCRHRIGR